MLTLVLTVCVLGISYGAPTTALPTEKPTVTSKPPVQLANNQYLIEFEDFAFTNAWENDNARVPDRSGASSYKSLHLFKHEAITTDFCLPIEQDVSIRNIFFSNDGWVDILSVEIDGKPIGKFRSADESNWGRLWNEFNFTGPLGESQNLIQGRHEITIVVEDGDKYGVELDALKLEFSRPDVTKDLKCPEEAGEQAVLYGEGYLQYDENQTKNTKSGNNPNISI
ncbi:hypothetical protein LOTGIDRAFT_161972 [Lottia gigantea]|uniref:Galectin n=1 Tax=Lottia gigantea TaxID=225164 RepID=V4AE60_LOTGI|nr:hypothetical protein LOTGIDRAFT_161972 [Lottia gigantea]ESO93400.1 hypothetical protein LOTGIDRAFT_161972 [Lottia gigantea]